jgi:hypothetical protein
VRLGATLPHAGFLQSASLLWGMEPIAPLLVKAQAPTAVPYPMVVFGKPRELIPSGSISALTANDMSSV